PVHDHAAERHRELRHRGAAGLDRPVRTVARDVVAADRLLGAVVQFRDGGASAGLGYAAGAGFDRLQLESTFSHGQRVERNLFLLAPDAEMEAFLEHGPKHRPRHHPWQYGAVGFGADGEGLRIDPRWAAANAAVIEPQRTVFGRRVRR